MWRLAGWASAVGLEIVVAIVIGGGGGWFLDRKLDTGPWLTYLGFLAGIGAAVKALIRVTRQYQKKFGQDEKEIGKPQSEAGDGREPDAPKGN